MPASARARSLFVAAIIIAGAGTARTAAQDAGPPTEPAPGAAVGQHRELEFWALSGLDAAISNHWSGTVRIGYAGGFDSAVAITDISYAPDAAMRLIAGHALIRSVRPGAAAISVLRAGGAWLPLSGRVELEHQGLVERVAGGGRQFFRLRNRLRLNLGLAARRPLRAFFSAEVFAVRESAFSASRYQAGAMLSDRQVRFEVYLVRQEVRDQRGFTALGLSAIWTIDRRR